MENDLLIDLTESIDFPTGNGVNKPSETVDAKCHLDSFLGVGDVSVSRTGMINNAVDDLLMHSSPTLLSPFKCATNNKRLSVESSLSSSKRDCNGESAAGGKMKGRAQSLTFDFINTGDSLEIISPFGCSKPQSASSLKSVSLLDTDPSKVMSPSGFLVSWGEKGPKNEVPVGDLLDVEEEPKLPDDMFDLEVLEKKQSEHLPHPALNVVITSTASCGSYDASSDGTLNRGFMDTVSSFGETISPHDDSVFEEALALAKEFSQLAAKGSCSDSIENEDEGIVYECPGLNDENMGKDIFSSEGLEDIKQQLELYSKDRSPIEDVAEQERVIEDEPHLARNSIAVTPIDNGRKDSSFSSGGCSISPLPLSTDRVDLMRLDAAERIRSKLMSGSAKLWASSSSATPMRSGPIKALIPMDQMLGKKSSFTSDSEKKSIGTPHLKVINPSPIGSGARDNLNITASTPRNHTMKNRQSYERAGNNLRSVDNRAKQSEGPFLTPSKPAINRSSSCGKIEAFKTNPRLTGSAVKRAMIPSPIPSKKFPNGPTRVGSGSAVRNPSPVVKRKLSHNPSNTLQTPIRSNSTGCLSNTGSGKASNSTTQFGALPSRGKSSSVSTKLNLNGRPLANACLNSPAKASSPLRKLMSKFRRIGPSRGMKENQSPV